MFPRYYISICLLLISSYCWADENYCEESAYSCVEVGELEINLALGYGVKDNPIVQRKDSDIYLIPGLSIYGEKWFLDSGYLGYTAFENRSFSINFIANLSSDTFYFKSFLDNTLLDDLGSSDLGSNIAIESDLDDTPIQGGGGGEGVGVGQGGEGIPPEPEIPPVAEDESLESKDRAEPILSGKLKRNWAVNAGAEINYFFEPFIFRIQAFHDITNTHDGYGVNFNVSYSKNINDVLFIANAVAKYRSENWLNYFYGLSPDEVDDIRYQYKADDGVNTYVSFALQKRLSENFSLFANYKYEKWASSITDSPIFEDEYTQQWFTGIIYHF